MRETMSALDRVRHYQAFPPPDYDRFAADLGLLLAVVEAAKEYQDHWATYIDISSWDEDHWNETAREREAALTAALEAVDGTPTKRDYGNMDPAGITEIFLPSPAEAVDGTEG